MELQRSRDNIPMCRNLKSSGSALAGRFLVVLPDGLRRSATKRGSYFVSVGRRPLVKFIRANRTLI